MNRAVDFGKYRLIERLNVGGMAEVFKAKMYGVEGFERLVAVKRILPSIAEDNEFITMFVDEAKIAVQLTHANIAQIFDLGKVKDSFYIAMEYVEGKDLRAIFDRQRALGKPMPFDVACYLVMKVCEGLDYAHNKRGQDGRHLALVHRDVSPQNILVSFEGEVKVIDFGIAKAAGKAGKTRSGILKGKFSYMSPEQSRGLPLDRRSDLFTAGICLYELITGERLFLGETDISTVEKVRNVEVVPPRQHNPSIPRALEHIILKSLAKRPEDRYQDAMAFYDALQKFLIEQGRPIAQREARDYMQRTFAREIAKLSDAVADSLSLEFDSSDSTAADDALDDMPPTRAGESARSRLSAEEDPRRAAPTTPPPVHSIPAAPSPRIPHAPAAPGYHAARVAPSPAPRPSNAHASPVMSANRSNRFEPIEPRRSAPQPQAYQPQAHHPPPGPIVSGSSALAYDAEWDEEDYPTEEFHDWRQRQSRPSGVSRFDSEAFDDDESATFEDAHRSGRRRAALRSTREPVTAPRSRRASRVDDELFDDLSYSPPPRSPAAPARASASSHSRAHGTPSPFEIDSVPEQRASGVTAVTEYFQKSRRSWAIGFGTLAGAVLLAILAFAAFSVLDSRRPGTVQLEVAQPGVTVEVDGTRVVGQQSPFLLSDLSPGEKHVIAVHKPGFAPWSTEVALSAGQVLRLPPVNLQPSDAGTVDLGAGEKGTGFILRTEPSGATVTLDGQLLDGKSPLRVTGLTPGQHTLAVEASHRFEAHSQTFTVKAGEVRKLDTVKLMPKAVTLNIRTRPDGLPVVLTFEDGSNRPLGRTPVVSDVMTADGPKFVTIEGPRGQKERLPVEVTAGKDSLRMTKAFDVPRRRSRATRQRSTRRAQSRPRAQRRAAAPAPSEQGTLRVNSRPWAELKVDGRSVGNTPQMNLKVDAGPHTLTFYNPDFDLEKTVQVNVKPGETTTKIVRLE